MATSSPGARLKCRSFPVTSGTEWAIAVAAMRLLSRALLQGASHRTTTAIGCPAFSCLLGMARSPEVQRDAFLEASPNSLMITPGEPSRAPQDQAIVEGEELEANDARVMKTHSSQLLDHDVSRPGRVRPGGDHGEDRVAGLVELPVAQNEGRPPLGTRTLRERKGHYGNIAGITDHGRLLRLREKSTRRGCR